MNRLQAASLIDTLQVVLNELDVEEVAVEEYEESSFNLVILSVDFYYRGYPRVLLNERCNLYSIRDDGTVRTQEVY